MQASGHGRAEGSALGGRRPWGAEFSAHPLSKPQFSLWTAGEVTASMSQSVKDKRAKARPGRGPRPGSVNAGDRGRGGRDGSLAPLAAPRVLACPGGRVCSCTSLPELRVVSSGHGSRVPLASRWRGLERSQPRPAPQSTRQDWDPRGRTPAPSATLTPTPPEALSSSGAGSCRGCRPSPQGGGGGGGGAQDTAAPPGSCSWRRSH